VLIPPIRGHEETIRTKLFVGAILYSLHLGMGRSFADAEGGFSEPNKLPRVVLTCSTEAAAQTWIAELKRLAGS
jgi:hypothetical protein